MESESTKRQIGPWRCSMKLGEGGNATVWEATADSSAEPVALKVLNSHQARGEPYRRFVQEIETLRSIGPFEGVLPLLDAYLPEAPSKDDRPWLAMPIAIPIVRALDGRPLDDVVLAVGAIATTLANLLAEHGISHRDIKPGNLYEFEGRWAVGDFGLIAVPDADALTQGGKPMGPLHYSPYEMLVRPHEADPALVDVYSLAKTLWVLATGQTFPPEGHQPARSRGFSISDLRPHPHAALLDELIDRATRLHPEGRPSMPEMATDLGHWTTLAENPVAIDVSGVGRQIRERLANEFAEE